MQANIIIESGESRYEVVFNIDDGEAASERLGTVIADIEKRFVKRRTRESAPAKPKSPQLQLPAMGPGGAK